MRKSFYLVLVILMFSCLIFAQGKSEEKSNSKGASKKYVLKIASNQGEKDATTMAMQEVADRLNASGLFDAKVYSSSALGNLDDIAEQAIQGTPILGGSDPGRLMAYVPEFGVIAMPYLLKDYTLLDKLLETPKYKEWEKEFEKKGVKLITSNWYTGARNFVLNKEVNSPADLAGQKIRTIGSPVYIESVNAMGAVATPMAWSEVYPGIEQGAIDGAEVQTTSSYATRLYELCKYTNKTKHFQLIGCLIMGTKVFDTWSKEAQDCLIKSCRDVGTKYQMLTIELEEKYEAEMKEKGMIINEVDPTPFIEAVQPIYAKLGYSELRKVIMSELGE